MTIPIKSELASQKVQSAVQSLAQLTAQGQTSAIFICRNVLNGGEVSPNILARYDLPRYQTGCEKLLNMIPLAQGGITKRPGLEYLGESSRYAMFIPFIASADDCLMLEVNSDNLSVNSYPLKAWNLQTGKAQDCACNIPTINNGFALSTAQSADVIFCASRIVKPFKIMHFPDHWEVQNLHFIFDYKIESTALFNTWIEFHAAKRNGQEQFPDRTDEITYYAITAVSAENGIESQPFYFETLPGYDLSSNVWVEMYLQGLPPGVAQWRIYKKHLGVYGFIGTSAGNETFYDKGIKPDTADSIPENKDLFDQEHPLIVFLHQQRLGFASSMNKPLTVWLSQAGVFDSFQSRKPPKDDEAIEVALAATQANDIVWVVPDRNTLAIGTQADEWTLTGGGEAAALTPSNLAFQSQSAHGSQMFIPALRVADTIIYLQKGGHVVRQFGYSFQNDKYQSQDISLLARHILHDAKVISWAWQKEPQSIIWMVLSDGTCAALTYMPEHEVIAWHRHTTPGGKFLNVATIPGKDGNDQVWFHIERDGKYSVERLRPFIESSDPSVYDHTDGKDKLEFQARCIPTMPEMNTQNGNTMMRFKKINSIKCRVLNSKPFYARIGDSNPMQVPVRGDSFTKAKDWNCPIAGAWREGDKLEFIFDGPDPVTLLAVTSTVELADLGGSPK